jgi:SAM-dependent methyltransferase
MTVPTNPFDRIADFYDRRVAEFGHDPRSCDYGRAESQRRKFQVLSDSLDYRGRSVLDVGCGFADFATFLAQRHEGVCYSGVDLSPSMIDHARAKNPCLDLKVTNILEEPAVQTHDFVIANGIFYLLGAEAPQLMRRLVEVMFSRCREAVVFNSLSTWASIQEPGEFYADPLETLAWCRELSPRVALRHDYLPHDFLVMIRRANPPA